MSLILFKHRNYGQLSIRFGCRFLLGMLFSCIMFDKILVKMIELNLNLRKSGYERSIYERLPFPLTHKFYVFNVLNKDEVQNGAKPHFQEIGPFTFNEFIWKENIIDDDEADTMEFDIWRRYVFRPDLSNGLTGDEVVTIIHPVLIGIGLAVHFEYRQFMHVAVAAIREIFHEPTDVFWTGRVMDLLFDGIEIDCDTKDPLAKVTCNQIRKVKNPAIQSIDDKRLKFSILGGYHNTSSGRWKVLRGQKNVHDGGRVIEVDGQSEISVWNGERCNQIIGTDGLLFSPLRRKDQTIDFFVKQLCAPIQLHFKRMASYRGMDVYVFTKEFEEFAANNLTCFCRQPDKCPIKGTMDLLPCLKVPVTISLPHFLHADPSLLSNIASGLSPIEKNHEFFFGLHLISGVPFIGAGRIQVNFELDSVKEIEIMSQLPQMLFPLMWFEISVDLPDLLVDLLKYTLSFGIFLNSSIKLISLTYWLFGTIFCSTMYILKRFTNINIIEVEKTFTKSPNGISKIGLITMVSELPPKTHDLVEEVDGVQVIELSNEKVQNDGVIKNNAVPLLNEIAKDAAEIASKNQLPIDFDSLQSKK